MSACSLTGNGTEGLRYRRLCLPLSHETLAARLTIFKKPHVPCYPDTGARWRHAWQRCCCSSWRRPSLRCLFDLKEMITVRSSTVVFGGLRNPCPAYLYSFVSFRLHSEVPQGEHSTLRPPNRAQEKAPGYFTSAPYEVSPSVHSI